MTVAGVRAAPADRPVDDAIDHGRPNLRVFTDKDGLSQNAVTSLAFDHRGYLWAGTKDGAVRYDGHSWTVVNLPREVGTNWVTSLLVASDDSLWLGTGGGGLAHLKDGTWTLFDGKEGPLGNEISCLFETVLDGRQVLFAGTNRGLARYDDAQWRREVPIAKAPDTLIDSMVATTAIGGQRALWFGSLLDGVARFENGGWTVFDAQSGLPARGVTCLRETTAIDGRPMLVAGTFDNGILVFDGTSWSPTKDTPLDVRVNSVQCLLESRSPDGSPVLWAGTAGGLCRYEHGRWLRVGSELGMPEAPIWSLAQVVSTAGTTGIWAGTAGLGLVHWQLGGWTAFTTTTGLVENPVYSVLASTSDDGTSVLWVGTNTKGLARLERGVWTYALGPEWANGPGVRCLVETRDAEGRRVLCAGTDNALLRFENGTWTSYTSHEGLDAPVNCILSTTAPDGAGLLLVGTNHGILALENGAIRRYDPGIALPDPRVSTLLETQAPDGTKTLWVGTPGGLVRFEQGAATVYDARSGLPSDQVKSLHVRGSESGARTLWIGTPTGVAVLDLDAPGRVWTYLSTTTTPALPNNMIYRIEEDAARRIYLFTNKGIARLTPRAPTLDDPSSFEVYTYTVLDGLPSNECNTGASAVDDHGRIWVGTIGGVGVFDPSREIDDTTPKPLVLQRAFLPDQARPLASGDSLAHDESHVEFEFALLSYFREGDTRYRAQLVGFDDEPSDWSAEGRRNYISLPPGDYRFRVWGRDALGNVSGPVEVPFVVRPAPWFTWWAFLFYAIAAFYLAYAAFRFRVRAFSRRNELLEARIAERTTQLAHTVDDLRSSERRALEANRAKSAFLASMSHELRTPLNAILGFVQLIAYDTTLSRSHRESLGIISRSGEHLLGLINDVLSIAKIEAGRETLDEQTFDLHHLLRAVQGMIQVRAEAKGLSVELVLDPDLPVVVHGDEGKLRQVLVNLLGNAVKFTDEGLVALRARWQDGEAGADETARGRATFEVRDTGCGIAEQDLARLFEAFVQTESGKRAQEGTGLGLVISRDFVRLMGGDIRVTSAPGVGTTFTFDAALGVASRLERRTGGRRRAVGLAPDSPAWRILVVDDTDENRLLIRRLLDSIGFEVREAADGSEAVAAWAEWRPHLIWMDMRMPVMDGLEATREIRSREAASGERPTVNGERSKADPTPVHRSPFTVHPTKIIALTASAFDHERERFLSGGCDDFVPKPFKTATILEKMAQHLGVQYVYDLDEDAQEAPAAESSALTPDRLSVLSAEVVTPLKNALLAGDVEAAMRAIEPIRERDPALADDLTACVRGYRFDEILDWIEPIDVAPPGGEHAR